MSIYNSSIKTHIIDPVYNRANFRAEYRIPSDTVVLSNLRMVGLGATGNVAGKYNGLVGALGVIKQISLYDDNQLLDQLLEAPTFMAFKQQNKSNQEVNDLSNALVSNRVGNTLSGVNAGAGQTGQKINEYEIDAGGVNTAEDTTRKAHLPLKDVLPLLKNLVSMDTSIFKNLKVVVEYNKDLDEFLQATNNTPYNTTEAQLIVDEVVGDVGKQKLGGFKGVSYTSIEHDRAVCPAFVVDTDIGDGTNAPLTKVKNHTFHINGFNNKTVGRMLICKNPTLLATYKAGNNNLRAGKLASFNNNNEALQVRVNGGSLIAGKGLTRENQRLGMLNDVWGKCSNYPFGNSMAYREVDGTNRNTLILGGKNDIGKRDWYGLNINNKVEDLQIDFERKGVYIYGANPVNHPARKVADDGLTTNAHAHQKLIFNIFCEVYKSITPSGNGYIVSYD